MMESPSNTSHQRDMRATRPYLQTPHMSERLYRLSPIGFRIKTKHDRQTM